MALDIKTFLWEMNNLDAPAEIYIKEILKNIDDRPRPFEKCKLARGLGRIPKEIKNEKLGQTLQDSLTIEMHGDKQNTCDK